MSLTHGKSRWMIGGRVIILAVTATTFVPMAPARAAVPAITANHHTWTLVGGSDHPVLRAKFGSFYYHLE